MRKIIYLNSCSTCKRIIKEINSNADFELHEIRKDPLTEEELEHLAKLAGGFSFLLNKRSIKYRELGLREKQLSDEEIKSFILKEDTLLKRPVIVIGNKVIAGSEPGKIEAVKSLSEQF